MKLELKKFDPSVIKSDSVVVFIGKRNTGKSYCMKDILSHHKELPVGIVVSPTETANNYFEKFVPNMLIYDEYDPVIIKKFLERQISINKQKGTKLIGKFEEKLQPHEIFDANFDSQVYLFENTYLAEQKIKIKKTKTQHLKQLNGSVLYMVCDDSRCMPPIEVPFTIQLK